MVPVGEANLSVASSAVLYGLSVYTVLPIVRTASGFSAFRLPEHFKRLSDSAKIIGLDMPSHITFENFTHYLIQTVAANEPKENVFARATIHVSELVPGTRSRGLKTLLSIFLYEAMLILSADGVRLKTSAWRRVPDYAIPSRAKVNGAYVNSVLAKQDALDSGYDDCIFLDAAGHVCELSAANIFLVRDGILITPNASSDVLEGITRRTVLDIASELEIPYVERSVDLTELYIADEVFASGTSASIASVAEIDKRRIMMAPGPITMQLRDRYVRILRGEDVQSQALLTPLRQG